MNKQPESASVDFAAHPADMLLSCHQQIRSYVALILDLTNSSPAPSQIVETMTRARGFLAQTLIMHASDEDLSVAPRLRRAAGVSDNVIHALDIATRQHPDIERVVSRLLPLLQDLQKNPQRLPQLAAPLRDALQRLSVLWSAHLSLEEETIFPAMRQLLSASELETIAREIGERHANSR